MKLPRVVTLLGYAGLLPFLAEPLWLSLSPTSAPAWLDPFWHAYVVLIAAFLAGTFWGFALPAVEGANGILGMVIATALMLLTWVAMLLPLKSSLWVLAVVFLLLLLADFWRERTLDTIPGYFALRSTLTAGTLIAIGWRLFLMSGPQPD